MSFFDKFLGEHKSKKDLQEEALNTVDEMICQMEVIRNNPDMLDAEKEDKLRLMERELRTFAEGMGWKYDDENRI